MLTAIDDLFRAAFHTAPTVRAPLAGDGSRRRMVRLADAAGHTAIAVIGPDRDENRAFLSFSQTFRELGLPVPQVLGADERQGVYLLEDLGDETLFDALTRARASNGGTFPASMLPIYRRVLEHLTRFQVEGGLAIDYGVAYPRARYDAQAMQWDCNYFKYDFLKLAHAPFHEARLEEDFARLIDWLQEAGGEHFVYRDFQSRNVMLRGEEPWYIDYQGGLQGPLQYDVAKLLYEGKAALPRAVRRELLEHYLEALSRHLPVDRARFLEHFRGFVVLRILQGLGAYGFLGLYERKPQFLARIPHALDDIQGLLADGFLPIAAPELQAVFERLVADPALRGHVAPPATGLTVRIGSFSYKRGIPADPAGHGGGFVFDCRALPNPGRLAEHAGRSGLDGQVAAYLDAQPPTAGFLKHAHDLVAAQLDVYERRGFDSLHVLFGCTGGQHRSPYCAERLAAGVRERFPAAQTVVTHAEALHWPATARRAGASPLAGTDA